MERSVAGARRDAVVTTKGARDSHENRGPSHVSHAAYFGERIRTVVVEDHEDIARLVANRIATLIQERNAAGETTVLGLATGSTPIGVYRELIRMRREDGLSFANVVTFNLDEYYPMPKESIHSYHRFMWENLFSQIDIKPENVHIPPGDLSRTEIDEAAQRYENAIERAGGIDFQILGIGKTGHIGFNEPGSGSDSHTRLVTLDAVTRKDAAADFFGDEFVPREAVTMGVATILNAREIAIIATGEHKAGIVQRAVEGDIDVEVAATFLQRHPNTTFYLDRSAAAELTRIKTPWLIDEVDWTPDLIVRAVIWLSQQTDKAILKLTQRDYADARMSSLVAKFGSPGEVNGKVFNVLGAKIRGKSKLPIGRKIICFSPHPDDDVISMGGILRKVVENDNDIVVAYMTSGNIAVFDHDVRRHLDFLERMGADGLIDKDKVDKLAGKVHESLEHKTPGEVDIPEVQDIKRIIREAEAVSGIETVGLPRNAARFLDLPFYQTGKVRKDPITQKDVDIVRALLEEVKPDLIFVAGDLSDPHGTHRMCKEAIDRALAELGRAERAKSPNGDFASNETQTSGSQGLPEVWLYRGAWQEWPIHEATWLVPLSQEELRLKIQAIFKHQSQKDSAPFPGGYDEREFWQRVEARNKGTAAELDRLGLAEYFAMEAYVVE
ncbi:MAG TPA: glucosamine-6-phosphate deaminase [Gemmatimonadaceae bacterium]|jgi:glucosamine-6-phosphate deaminase|nr:glucosamine-6-phosphate deaminase [Gemmatimonadaceae bacterium]